jgi:hypothetical protein
VAAHALFKEFFKEAFDKMELTVRISATVSKRLKTLRRGDGNALQAAEHARSIIKQVLEGVFTPKQIGRLTKYGEARIPNCVKFDLVRGYRLVAVLGKQEIYFLFVGSHDECDHWIRNNAGLEFPAGGSTTGSSRVLVAEDDARPSLDAQEEETEADDYDASLLSGLTDRDLRIIFSGLCCKQQ